MISVVAAIVTEFVSNTATANILVPILVELSKSLCRNPIHLGMYKFDFSHYDFIIIYFVLIEILDPKIGH